jgi:hypothetical protein
MRAAALGQLAFELVSTIGRQRRVAQRAELFQGSVAGKLDKATVPNNSLTIASNPATGNPAAISRGFGALNSRQAAVLEQLPEFGSSTVAHKSFGQRDLSALTAATGDEFAMFSTGGRRMIFRGDASSVPINP